MFVRRLPVGDGFRGPKNRSGRGKMLTVVPRKHDTGGHRSWTAPRERGRISFVRRCSNRRPNGYKMASTEEGQRGPGALRICADKWGTSWPPRSEMSHRERENGENQCQDCEW